MASSIIGGLIESGTPAASLRAADPFAESLERLRQTAPIAGFADNRDAVDGADVVILAVKPQVMDRALQSIADAIQSSNALVISIAAGTTIAAMQNRLGGDAAIVRCMPNTPALLGCGASALYATPEVGDQQRDYAQQILEAVGLVRWVDSEQALDAITALSGSGPAYFFLFTEAMIDTACELGLDRETATAMAQQTALGAARMALESEVDLVELRRRVTSPGGTTAAAIASFEADQLHQVIGRAMRAAAERAEAMGRDAGEAQ